MKSILTLVVAFLILTQNNFSQELAYSTYLGGSGNDGDWNWLTNLEIDEKGNVYFVTSTYAEGFPLTDDAYQKTYNGGNNMGAEDLVFVNFNIEKNKLDYSTYFGGKTGPEFVSSILKKENDIYFAGNTGSKDFPVTENSFDNTFNGPDFRHADGYITHFADNKLAASTYVGGSGYDWIQGVFTAENDEVIVVGVMNKCDELPITQSYSTERDTANGNVAVFRFTKDLDKLLSLTVLGPSWYVDADQDEDGNIYIVGSTYSKNFPTTEGAYDRSYNGGTKHYMGDLFVTKLNPTGEKVLFSTFLGGSGEECFPKICLDNDSNILVTATTTSTDFPITENAFDKSFDGGKDVLLTKLKSDGSEILYSTYVGGKENSRESARNIVVSKNGKVYLCGLTDAEDFQTTENAIQKKLKGATDIFIIGFDEKMNNIEFSSYLGGTGDDDIILGIDDSGNLIGVGNSNSKDFPMTGRTFDKTLDGESDIVIFKITMIE